ncbi:MAG: conjugal transfer protein TrbF [Gammaproteobacteria bacterium]|nr:conjugal transfer protein TrbF [Gammaproteobacteria bacterium]
MRFRRPSVRYSTTPPPATPYQAAQQRWDERIGSARVQALNWRRMAFGCLILSGFIAGGLLAQLGRSTITPYVVEVDRLGEVRAVGPATETYRPSEAQLAYHLEQFIRRVRSRSIDPIVLRDNWLAAYDTVTDRGAATLNDYARTNDPFARVGQTSVAVEVTSVVRASANSFQVRWIERAYANGALATTERWTAILTVLLNPPRDEQRLRQNPLGIYVDGLNWSRELNATG